MKFTDILTLGLITSSGDSTMYFVGILATIAAGYLIGSVSIEKITGPKTGFRGILIIIGEALKGILCAFIGMLLMPGDGFAYVCLLAGMIGQVYPVFFGFKGSQCFYMYIGAVLCMNPPVALLSAVGGVLLLLITKYKSAGRITMALIFPILNYYLPFTLFSNPTENADISVLINYIVRMTAPILLAGFLVFSHLENIKGMIKGTEEKWGSKNS